MNRIASIATLSLILVLLLVGVVQAQTPTPATYSVACFSDAGTSVVAASGCSYHYQSGSTLTIDTGTTFTWKSVTPSGPIRYGAYTVTTTGYFTITHGIGGTPTMAIIQATTDGYTATVTALGSTTITGRGSALAGQTIYWMAGK